MQPFIILDKLNHATVMEGAQLATVNTEQLTMAYTQLKAGTEIPLHQHEAEAIDIVLDGMLEMSIGDNTSIVKPGVITTVASQLPHSARAITDCKVVTILHPKREG